MRDYIHVSDLVQAHLDALTYLRGGCAKARSSIVDMAGAYSVLDVIKARWNGLPGHKLDVRDAPRRPGDAAEIIANADQGPFGT